MLDIFPENYKKKSLDPLKSLKGSQKKVKSASSSLASKSIFKKMVTDNVEVDAYNKDIDSFIEELDALQTDLIQNPSLELIENYRARIGKFLQHILSNYQSTSFYRGIKTRIELKVWHLLDVQMNQLSKKVISSHVEGFNVLSNLNMIKGLIIDLKIGK